MRKAYNELGQTVSNKVGRQESSEKRADRPLSQQKAALTHEVSYYGK
jgi:hypothetical protein